MATAMAGCAAAEAALGKGSGVAMVGVSGDPSAPMTGAAGRWCSGMGRGTGVAGVEGEVTESSDAKEDLDARLRWDAEECGRGLSPAPPFAAFDARFFFDGAPSPFFLPPAVVSRLFCGAGSASRARAAVMGVAGRAGGEREGEGEGVDCEWE